MNKKTILSSILGMSILLSGCQSELEKVRKGETKAKEETKKNEEKYTLDEAEKVLRNKLKNELKDEVKKEMGPQIEKEAKQKFTKEGYDAARKEMAADIKRVQDESLKIDDFFAKYQEK